MLTRRAALLGLPWLLSGCPNDQSLVLVGGDTVNAADIDREPLRLMPTGALLLATLDAPSLFQSSAGGDVARVVQNLLPVGPEAGVVAQRDVKRVWGGVYAMQGADFLAVVQGQFNVEALQRAAQARVQTPSGAPLVATRYGSYDIYTVANMGFVPLTNQTILSGNETSMRRALDRLRYGRLTVDLPGWMTDLLAQVTGGARVQAAGVPGMPPVATPRNENAAFALVGDISREGVVAAASERLPFLTDLGMMRVLGNFASPGMNLVGSLTYPGEEQARLGAERLDDLQKLAYLASLMATWGFGGRMPEMEVVQQGSSVAFATKLDTSLVSLMFRMIADLTAQKPATPGFWGF
ncbi:MAG: hypothetical protein KC731_36585 [Myxococcales bacterium]|nr:hypothetical protein [Myxococcales bacterium]